MIRKFFSGKYIVPVAALLFVACGPSEEEEEIDTPTPEAPMNDYFRVTSLEVGNEDEGVDVDGNGDIDNNIEVALTTIYDAVYSAIETALINGGIPFGDDCGDTPPCGDTIMVQVEEILDGVFSVESLSTALNQPVEEGNITYLMQFEEDGASINLNWYQGDFVDVGYAATTVLGSQPGSLDASGTGTFGPGDLTLTFVFSYPTQGGGTEDVEIPLVLYKARTDITGYNSDELEQFYYGGAISIDDLLELVRESLDSINSVLPPEFALTQDEIDAIVDGIEEALYPLADVNIDSDSENEGFSIGLISDAVHVTLVE